MSEVTQEQSREMGTYSWYLCYDSHFVAAGARCPRLLSLDGGGVRGLSSLLIIRRIMEQIRRDTHTDITPFPCHYFDLIGGTSTGGLIALMLGRLGMVCELRMS